LKNSKLNNILKLSLGFAVSALMLSLIQAPVNLSALAWVALVPFIVASDPCKKARSLYIAVYIISAIYWLSNLYWIALVTVAGWFAFCLYTALLWPLLVFCFRLCRKKKIPLFIAVPIFIVGAEHLQGLFLNGFYWRYLAHSQYANTVLIQIADIFGAAGVTFLIAMVNGLIAEMVLAGQKNVFKPANILKTVIVFAAIVATINYGKFRIDQTDQFVKKGPLVASVQSNIPQTVKESAQADNEIFTELLQNSEAAAEKKPLLIVWPETMVQGVLNKEVLDLLSPLTPHRIFDSALKDHAKNSGYILVGSPGGKPKVDEQMMVTLVKKYNSAFLYQPDGNQAEVSYNKIHLVPFGEVIPVSNIPWIHKLLVGFTPYDYDYTLDHGTEYTVFEVRDVNDLKYNFGVMICYEGAVPYIAKNYSLDKQGKKQVDWLINISNDGWFVRFEDGKPYPSTELPQHAAVCTFRAIENRLAIIRSVNTGISCLIDTLGRIKNGYIHGNLPNKTMDRKGMDGWFTDSMPIDERITFFSKYGQWLDFSCATCFIFYIIVGFISLKKKKIGSKNDKTQ